LAYVGQAVTCDGFGRIVSCYAGDHGV
jgi:hypothetical protein